MNVEQALRIKAASDSYPRCGQGWPTGPMEEAAHAALSGRDPLTGRTPEEDSAFDAEWDADNARRAAAKAAERKAAAEKVAAAAAAANGDLLTFVRAFGAEGVSRKEVESLFGGIKLFDAERKKRTVVVNRRDMVIAK